MAISTMPIEQMQRALRALDQGRYNHEQWDQMIHTTLICRVKPDERDLSSDAHRNCRFGQWYYDSGAQTFGDNLGFAEIGREHERVHRYAAKLLNSVMNDELIAVESYEQYVAALKSMHLEMATLRHELNDALYNVDPLTGVASRIGMLTKLREQQELVKRKVNVCSISILDLDHFKNVNDTYGHITGDRVLVELAHRIVARLRPFDKVFRYGGEEFLLCLPNTDLNTGRTVLERLREELSSMIYDGNGSEVIRVTVSCGLTLLDPDTPVEQSIDRADKALYAAKAAGRNCTIVWSPSLSNAISPA